VAQDAGMALGEIIDRRCTLRRRDRGGAHFGSSKASQRC
jgi:hypothetical protein